MSTGWELSGMSTN